jgi:hypothetical protein
MPDELTHPDEGGSGPSLDVLGIDADAITALNAALQGVEVLTAVVTLMEQSATGIVTATETGKLAIENHVKSPEVRQQIEDIAGKSAMQKVLDNISSIVEAVLTTLANLGLSSDQ